MGIIDGMSPEEAAVVFGLASAISWGAGDFSGGLASKRTNVYVVIVVSQIFGLMMLAAMAFLRGEPLPGAGALLLGAVAGLAGAMGLVALYRGLATSHMGVVAPLTAVVAAGLPVVVGVLLEGAPGALQLLGFACALGGVWFISRDGRGTPATLRALYLPLFAGLGFGLFFILIDRVSEEAIFWPLVAARLSSITFLSLRIALGRAGDGHQRLSRQHLPLILLTGLLETGGNVFFALASAAGRLDIASILASLYPAATVFLAWAVLKEQLAPRQWAGVVAVLASVLLITV